MVSFKKKGKLVVYVFFLNEKTLFVYRLSAFIIDVDKIT